MQRCGPCPSQLWQAFWELSVRGSAERGHPRRLLLGLTAGGSHAPRGSPGGALEASVSSGRQCAFSAGSQGARLLARKLSALGLTQPRSFVTQGGGSDSCVRMCVCVCMYVQLLKQPQTSTEKLEGEKSICLRSALTSVNTGLASSCNCIKVFFFFFPQGFTC